MPDIFQYSFPTVKVGPYEFDTATLNAYIRRAWSVYGDPKVTYALKGSAYGDPAKENVGAEPIELDCSGFAWYSTYRKRLGYMWDGETTTQWKKNWVEIPVPIAGAAIRHSAYPNQKHGHVGFVVAADGGNFQTLDSSSAKSPPRKGSIRYIKDGKSGWMKAPNVRFIVSTQALKSVNGVPYKPSLNIYLAAAKRPVLTFYLGITAGILAIAGGSYLLVKRRKRLASK